MWSGYRTALVTGASSGLGRGLAAWFAVRGVRVYAVARRLEHLQTLRDEVAARGGVVEPVPLDVSNARATHERLQALERDSGGLDLVIANAGVSEPTPARKLSWPAVERILQVNVLGAAATLSAVLPSMVQRNRGHLVGVSSLAAFRGMPSWAAYSASKAFLTTFLQGLRTDLVGTGLAVTTIHPGYVRTEMTADYGSLPMVMDPKEACERMAEAIVRREPEFSFPLPAALMGRYLAMMPDTWLGWAMNTGWGPKEPGDEG
jgi:short-subunit dehydrogenase